MTIQLLGTGTPTPSLKRMSSGYLVTVGDDTILFDHETGAHPRYQEPARSRPTSPICS